METVNNFKAFIETWILKAIQLLTVLTLNSRKFLFSTFYIYIFTRVFITLDNFVIGFVTRPNKKVSAIATGRYCQAYLDFISGAFPLIPGDGASVAMEGHDPG